jgi:hypothetical protein
MLQERWEKALKSPEPARSLRAVVVQLADEGHAKADIYSDLESFLRHVRASGKASETDEDAIRDVLDALSGWCHPTAQLLPDAKD